MGEQLGRTLFFFGGFLMLLGLLLGAGSRLGLGRLPGDIVYKRGNFTFYFPVVTSIVLSLLFSAVYRLFSNR